jgi:hypothetical protein
MQSVKAWAEQQRQQEVQRQQSAADQQHAQRLDADLTKFLTDKGYDPKLFIDDVRQHVFWRTNQMTRQGHKVEMEDVPNLAFEWLTREEQKKQHWLDGLRNGKQAGAVLPASPSPTPAAVGAPGELPLDAFGNKTKGFLEQELRKRGWT